MDLQKLWRYQDLADYLNCGVDKLRHDVMLKRIPFVKIGGCVRFNPEKIKQWLNENTNEVMP